MSEPGMFSYDPATRILAGLLIPFGEMSRTSITTPAVLFAAESITLPRDPSVVTLNRHHKQTDPIGRATLLEKREGGVYAEFMIADTDEGDAYLRDEQSTLRRLSAEVADMVRRGTQVVRSRLTGAALVTEGAFATAGLFALESSSHSEDTFTDEYGTTWRRESDSTTTTTDDAASTTTTTTTTTTETVTTAEADEPTAEPPQEEALMSKSIVPNGAVRVTPRPTLDGLFAAISSGNADALAPYRGAGDMFALKTLQHSGPTDVTISADTAVPDYLGELWDRAPYQRRIIPLLQTATLTAWEMKGWRWVEGKTPEVGDYAGNISEVPSNALDTESVTVTANRLAGGHRLDRRFTDFNDQVVVGSYLVHQTEDYKRKTDGKGLDAVKTAATVTTPGAVPAGIAKGLAAIVDGALDVIATENSPAYALVDPLLWRDILLTPKDDILAYLETGFGFEQGTGPGFTLRPASVGAGKVIVGAKEALTFYELGETPIRVDGVVPGNGATDIAVFGYWATLTNNAKAIRSVQVASA